MPEIQAVVDRVGAYRDALVLGHETTTIGLEPELTEAIQQFKALDPVPPSTARDRVWQRVEFLTREGTPVANVHTGTARHVTRIGPATTANGHLARPSSSQHKQIVVRPVGRWALTHLATVALLVLTLVGGLAVLWKQPPARSDELTQVPALIRALESVQGDVVDDVLVEATFTPDELPTGDVEAIFYRITLPPGVSLRYLPGPLCVLRRDLVTSGVGAEVVQSGTYGLRLDAPIQVRRTGASGVVEEIPAGTEAILSPGDAASYPDYSGEGTIRNAGHEPTVLTGVAIIGAEHSGIPAPKLPPGVHAEQLTRAALSDWRSLPATSVTVGLWRLTLPEGRSVGPYEAAGLEALWIESGSINRNFVPAGETAPRGPGLFYRAGYSASFLSPVPGVRRTITNTSDGPAVLLALNIEPAGVLSETLAP